MISCYLSEGVCRQLGIITYHQKVETTTGKAGKRDDAKKASAVVPSVRLSLVQSPSYPRMGCRQPPNDRVSRRAGARDGSTAD